MYWTKSGAEIQRIAVLIALAAGGAAVLCAQTKPALSPASRKQAMEISAALPMSFEANTGQTDPRVKFLAHASGYTLFLTDREAVLSLPANSPAHAAAHAGHRVPQLPGQLREASHPQNPARAVRLKFVGATTPAAIAGRDQLPGTSNYFIGNDPKRWHTNVPNYSAVEYRGIYSGVDAVFHGDNRRLEFDFDIAPGVDPNTIALEVEGARRIRLNQAGDVLLGMDATHDVVMGKPHIYQQSSEGRREIAGHYALAARNRIAFALGPYDHSRALVIDPTLAYSTYLGGSVEDAPSAIAVDSSGSAYITGQTYSANFPVTAGAYQTSCAPRGSTVCTEPTAFVTKLSPNGSSLIYATFLNGDTGADAGESIAVDSSGEALIIGIEGGELDFPTTPGAIQAPCNIGSNLQQEVFVAKLNPTGSSLVYSTCLQNPTPNAANGTPGSTFAGGIAVDGAGNAYVTGETNDPSDFPTTQASFGSTCVPVPPGQYGAGSCDVSEDPFVAKIDPAGKSLLYSTFLTQGQQGSSVTTNGIAVDSLGNAYVIGLDSSNSLITTLGSFIPSCPQGCEGFVLKINGNATALVYSTYLGGSDFSTPTAVAVDQNGLAYVTGYTQSTDFPTTPGVLQFYFTPPGAATSNLTDGFVVKVGALGDTYSYSTFLGGTALDTMPDGIAVDAAGDAFVTGLTLSGFPTTPDAFQTSISSENAQDQVQAFFCKLDPGGASLLYSTFLAGTSGGAFQSAVDFIASFIAVDASGNAYLTGQTDSTSFPTTPGAFQTNRPSTQAGQIPSGFVAKFSFLQPTPLTISPATLSAGTAGVSYPVTFAATGATGALNFAVTTGSLPSGLTLSSAGVLSGTPTQTGTFPFTVTATDSAGDTGSQAYSLTIGCPAITVGPSTLANGTVGTVYPAVTFTENGGVGTIAFSETGLPAGIGMSFAAGVLSGTPATAESFPITVTAKDSNSCTGHITDTFAIATTGLAVSAPLSLAPGMVNVGYLPTLVTATGGTGSYTWSATGLPAGMSIAPTTGTISGTPGTNTGSPFTVLVTVTDSSLATATRSYQLVIYIAKACDPLGLGAVTVADVQLILNEALGLAPVLNDLDNNGVVNVADVQIVVNALLRLGCAAM